MMANDTALTGPSRKSCIWQLFLS